MPRQTRGLFVPGLLLAGILTLGCGGSQPPPAAAPPAAPAPAPMAATPFGVPGLRCPPARPAAEVELPDDTPVVGVAVKGKARAYLLSALSKMTQHIVNDVVSETPVTVTYCDRTDCLCAFTADTPGKPLAVETGGWQGKMIIRVGQTFYWQDTGEPINPGAAKAFPYTPFPHERTTWKAWKQAHPETDIFTGM